MPNFLWKVTAIKNNAKVTKGMSVEIMKKDTGSKPSQKEIAKALNDKYSELKFNFWFRTIQINLAV